MVKERLTTIPQNTSENPYNHNINDTNTVYFEISVFVTKVFDIAVTAGVTQEHFFMNPEYDEIITGHNRY